MKLFSFPAASLEKAIHKRVLTLPSPHKEWFTERWQQKPYKKAFIDLDPEAYPLASTFHLVQPAVKLPEGVMQVVVSIGHLPNLGRIIARYGGAARVVSPPEARQVVRDFAIRALGVGSSRQAEIIGGED